MREIFTFAITLIVAISLIAFIGSKRKKTSRYDRHPKSDWAKLDHGIDPTE